ncbi:uroporphyrinogen-III methylase [Parashewanella curva]|uniref:Uroporphyrinogen-III methylase n=1 Tax=Parashewanella curva TaxID=2338552 RepID=A0A3L8PZS6_9GAMM|nr:uroporphyrinogen-III C-methyltransferase [Parashewanella curva]RLV60289.1 uroporphyrinogen-III methylase [Parashewanella curva]
MESAQTESEPSKTMVDSKVETTAKVKTSIWISLSILFCLAVSIAIVAAGYHFYTQQQLKELEWQQQLANVEQKLDQQSAHSAQLMARDQSLNEHSQQLQNQIDELETNVSGLAKRSPKHWMAAEADYLVRMAGRKLWLENDPLTSSELLKAADQQIAAMQDPSLLPIRKAISRDLLKVKSIHETDVSGAVFAIDGVIEQLNSLSLNQFKPKDEAPADDNVLSESINDWKENINKTWQALIKDFIHIRKRQGDVQPLMSPKQRWYLEENIKNKLLQAQLALYRNDEVNFHHSIKLAHLWLSEYFDLQDETTKNALNELEQLKKLTLSHTQIRRFDSVPLLKQLVTYGDLSGTKERSL